MMNAVDSAFGRAFAFTLRMEGVDLSKGDTGYVNNPVDPGGATNYGITQGTYDAYRNFRRLEPRDVKTIPLSEVQDLHLRNYWHDGRCDLFAGDKPLLALAHYDASVNLGLRQAAKCLQRSVGAEDDGMIGPVTLASITNCNEPAAIAAYLDDRARVYREIIERRPTSHVFLAGWLARCRAVARECGIPIGAGYAEGAP